MSGLAKKQSKDTMENADRLDYKRKSRFGCFSIMSFFMLVTAVAIGGYITYTRELASLDLTDIKDNIRMLIRSKEDSGRYMKELSGQTQLVDTNVKQWRKDVEKTILEQQNVIKTLQAELSALKQVPDVSADIQRLQATAASLTEQISSSEATRQQQAQETTNSIQNLQNQIYQSQDTSEEIRTSVQTLNNVLYTLKDNAEADILQLKQTSASLQEQIYTSSDRTDNTLRDLNQETQNLGTRLDNSIQNANNDINTLRNRIQTVAFSTKHRPANIATKGNAVMGFQDADVNIGEAFDTVAHKFIAPVAGIYSFSYSFESSGGKLQMVVDGVVVSGSTGAANGTVSYTDVVKLEAQQSVWLEVIGNSGKVTCSEKGSGCVFTGQLVAPL